MQLSPDIRIQMKEHLWMWLVWAALTMVPCVLICLGYETIGLAFTILLLSIPFLTTMKGQIVMLVLALPFEYQGIDLGFANIGIFDTAVLFFLIGLFLRVQMQDRFHLEREGDLHRCGSDACQFSAKFDQYVRLWREF